MTQQARDSFNPAANPLGQAPDVKDSFEIANHAASPIEKKSPDPVDGNSPTEPQLNYEMPGPAGAAVRQEAARASSQEAEGSSPPTPPSWEEQMRLKAVAQARLRRDFQKSAERDMLG